MNRRPLIALSVVGALALSACGGSSDSASKSDVASAETTVPAEATVDLEQLAGEAELLIGDVFIADAELDYDRLAELTTGAVAARFRNQELLGTLDDLDPYYQVPEVEYSMMTSKIELEQPVDGVIRSTGTFTETVSDASGEYELTFVDPVFELDGDTLLLADWRNEDATLPASAAFLIPGTVSDSNGDVTATLEPAYRSVDSDPEFVEYLFTFTNDGTSDVDVEGATFTTPDGEDLGIQFGVANTAEPGDTEAARVGFEGTSLPVAGGTLEIGFIHGDETFELELDVPPFLDADGEPLEPQRIELDDTTFSGSGTIDGGAGSSTTTDPAGEAAIFADAADGRQMLLDVAKLMYEPTAVDNSWGIPDAWVSMWPGLDVTGSAIDATPSSVSGFAIVVSKSTGQEGLPFAVMDPDGYCAGGVILASNGIPSEFLGVDMSSATSCSGDAVIQIVFG